jgi:glycosyltransferase involved in cell wall biosynthesis
MTSISNMRILYLTPSVSRSGGGVFQAVKSLSQITADQKQDVSLIAYTDSFTQSDHPLWHSVAPTTIPIVGPRGIGYAPSLIRAIGNINPSIIHVHGIWMMLSYYNHSYCKKHSVPYVVSPHGSLDPWALHNSRFKKVIASIAYENDHLRDAACIHALCKPELESIKAYGIKNPICMIPNGVDIPSSSRGLVASSDQKKLLFLGRLHPKKGLIPLLAAWSILKHSEAEAHHWTLRIAGWGSPNFITSLYEACASNGLSYTRDGAVADSPVDVEFCGPVYAEDKERLLWSSDAFILPSYSEGLPIAVLEAWAHNLPVLMTEECNIPEGFSTGAAVKIGTSPEQIVFHLNELLRMSTADRASMGSRGRLFVEKCYTWNTVANQMLDVYAWILGGGDEPESVFR